jgi:hypothetical protein
MAAKIVAFDADNKLHQDLLDSFKQDLLSEEYDKDHIYCQYIDYIDELEIVALNIATEELGLDEDFDECCSFAIQNSDPQLFTVIVGLEFIDYDKKGMSAEFIKVGGQILIDHNKSVILDIDQTLVDYSSSREFHKAKRFHKVK